MRVLALLSGGKDSVCAAETAMSWGWDVVAGLTMVPAEDDAWMFHTPNLAVVRGVAECLGLPLIEAPARTGKTEEVEDLGHALVAAKAELRLDGIVSGALASEYQKTRLDMVCHRAGLASFAPLWHKEPRAYVTSLVDGGWDIRFSRTAADGVPNSWAGGRLDAANVQAMAGHRSRPHVAGEGGEYETLVLDAPCYKRVLVVEEAQVALTSGRATWNVDRWSTVPKRAGGVRGPRH